MIECTIDTHILAEILMQYSSAKPNLPLTETEFLTLKILSKVNQCILSGGFDGIVVASAFAFIEIINQFQNVSKGKFSLSKLIGLLNQPPDWFIVEPYSSETAKFLISVPKYNLLQENVELADAIHVATAMQRGPQTYLATLDGVLSRLNYKNLGIKHLA
jgi:predicted nucleic acid-binding protein